MRDSDAPTASWQNLKARAALLRRLRTFFEAAGYLEVETPLLSADTVVDRHLDPIVLELRSDPCDPGSGQRKYLQTSPEFCMKRLLAAGGQRIFQVCHAFRTAEQGELHNPEFTMVEWYTVGHDMYQEMDFLGELACSLLDVEKVTTLSYRDAFQEKLGFDPLVVSDAELLAEARSHLVKYAGPLEVLDRDSLLDLFMVEFIQPDLGQTEPVILYEYPASQAALARIRVGDPPVAERFELFVNGLELANGYHELLDAAEMRARNAAVNQLRTADGKECLPEESRLLTAMDHGLPACSGVALGFDRLVMVAVGAKSIREVTSFPIDRA